MTIQKSLWKAFGTSMLLVATPFAAMPVSAAIFDLVAAPFSQTMPDGTMVAMWGYAIDDGVSTPSAPGPELVVPPGDPVLTINLRNALTAPVSIVIPGQVAAMAPVTFTDGNGRQRVRSFTAETAPGAIGTYTWNNPSPGTYLYHSGTHPAVQMQMGLYGSVKKNSAAGTIYPGVTYDNEATLFFSEIDPALHTAVANGTYGTVSGPTSTLDYAPKYFLVNGAPYITGAAPIPAGAAGQKTLLRFLNAGLKTHAPVIQGSHVRLVAEDGKPYPYAREQYSVFLPAGKTADAIMTPAGAATNYPVYDRRLSLTNGATPGGGMLTYLAVAGTSGGPTALADTATATEDTLLTVAAPGVLANDSGTTLSAVLVGSPSHGVLTFPGDGSYTYLPAANFSGTDTFTYRASDGVQSSDPAIVSITVNPVNDAPVAANNVYSVVQGGTLAVAAPGVLGNDSDPDGNALTAALVTGPVAGTLTLNADGSFNYVAPATAGTQSFTYQASDGLLPSNTATVTLTVFANRAPVAVNDTVSAPARRTVAYTPRIITVLANDSDPDAPANTIDPATVTIATTPNKGGTVSVNANGSINYTPRLAFRGTETFSYRVRDTLGAFSNAATVRVNVR